MGSEISKRPGIPPWVFVLGVVLALAAGLGAGAILFGRDGEPPTNEVREAANGDGSGSAPSVGPAPSIRDLEGCPIFPADNFWHADVSRLPIHSRSSDYIRSIGTDESLFPDFGSGLYEGSPIGIPYTVVGGNQPKVDVSFDYSDESDPGPYPIPQDAPIEGGPQSDGDRHVLVLDKDNCVLYEMFDAQPQPDGSWKGGSGAVFDLRSNQLRPKDWTSADGAGLSILAGLVRYEEIAAGVIDHAIRFTAKPTADTYVWPARHKAGTDGASAPPMGTWLRLKAGVDISGFSQQVQVILEALKKHGMILSDNGSPIFITGSPDERWDNDDIHTIGQITGADFEVVDVTSIMVDSDSGAVR